MATYRLTQAAGNDLRALYRYGVRTFDRAAADHYYDGLIRRLEKIAEHPRWYQAVEAIRPGYRRSIYGVPSLYYQETPQGVTLVRILHGQDPETSLSP